MFDTSEQRIGRDTRREEGARGRRVYLSCFQSLGAAHSVAQCVRWKTEAAIPASVDIPYIPFHSHFPGFQLLAGILTLLNAVLMWALEVGILAVSGDALNALIEVVLVGGTFLGLGALCMVNQKPLARCSQC